VNTLIRMSTLTLFAGGSIFSPQSGILSATLSPFYRHDPHLLVQSLNRVSANGDYLGLDAKKIWLEEKKAFDYSINSDYKNQKFINALYDIGRRRAAIDHLNLYFSTSTLGSLHENEYRELDSAEQQLLKAIVDDRKNYDAEMREFQKKLFFKKNEVEQGYRAKNLKIRKKQDVLMNEFQRNLTVASVKIDRGELTQSIPYLVEGARVLTRYELQKHREP